MLRGTLCVQDGAGCVREHAGEALALAHFLDETWAQRPARRIEASPWYEAAVALASRLLGQHTRSAPKVTPSCSDFLYTPHPCMVPIIEPPSLSSHHRAPIIKQSGACTGAANSDVGGHLPRKTTQSRDHQWV